MTSRPGEVLKALRAARAPLIVTHWDMDGVASAILAASLSGGGASVYVPPLTYRLTRPILDEIEARAARADLVVLTDLAYPGPSLKLIHRRVRRKMVVVDHHRQPQPPDEPGVIYYNPAAGGDPRASWPSAAYVIDVMAGGFYPEPLLVAASIVGDLGDSARGHPAYRSYMTASGLDPDRDFDLVKEHCVDNIDGAAAMGEVGVIVDVIERVVLYGEQACMTIMKDDLLVNLKVKARYELEELAAAARPREEDGVLVYELEGEGMHASRLARMLAGRHRGRVVVVAYTSRRLGQARIYARVYGSERPPLGEAVECLRALGYSAGGKTQAGNNVLAVEVDAKEAGDALEAVLDAVKQLMASGSCRLQPGEGLGRT